MEKKRYEIARTGAFSVFLFSWKLLQSIPLAHRNVKIVCFATVKYLTKILMVFPMGKILENYALDYLSSVVINGIT